MITHSPWVSPIGNTIVWYCPHGNWMFMSDERGSEMLNTVKKIILVLMFGGSSILMNTSVLAQEWPLVQGDFWEVTGIDIKDGGGWKYANWIAEEWRKDSEFAKSKGWIKDYMVFSNVHGRSDEPDLYLIWIMERISTGPEGEKRFKEYLAWKEKSIEALVGESGNRAEYREVMSDVLLQELTFRD